LDRSMFQQEVAQHFLKFFYEAEDFHGKSKLINSQRKA
jgi:hypothetical protein